MRFFPVMVATWMAAATAAFCEAAPIPTEPIHTNKAKFRIPYRLDAAEMQRIGAREIRLYLSTDRGGSWRHVQSVVPGTGRFEFEAPEDGSYWFAVRTLDAQNRLHPDGPIATPGLKVIVDRRPPTIDIVLKQLEPGRVHLAWNAIDTHFDPSTLKLEYIQSGATDWQPVSIVPRASGQTSWSAPQGGYVAVRGVAADMSSNVGRSQSQVKIEPASNAVPRPNVPDFSQPIASGESSLAATYPPAAAPQQFAQAPESSERYTAPSYPTAVSPGLDAPGYASQQHQAPVISPAGQGPTAFAPGGPIGGQLVGNDVAAQPEVTTGRYPTTTETARPSHVSGRARVVNSKVFDIGYKVEDVGPSGVGAIEFYITEDEGRKWWKYGNDSDRTSPFRVKVPRDGTFGFAMRVRSGAGLAADPPQPGEKPSIVVVVDQSPPEVRLYPVRQGKGVAINKLEIRWQVVDANPSDRPIALYYAGDRNGPWEPISGWQPDRGSYIWTVGPGVPSKLYIRLVARDVAGNTSRTESQQPVVVDLSKPSARIVDIESIGVSSGPR